MRIPIEDDFDGDISNVQYDMVDNISQVSDGSIKGKIKVEARIGSDKGGLISSAKINLYMLNGVSPKLVTSKLTDDKGVVVFDNLEKGSYRVIAIADKRYFDKPLYRKWNEVTISKDNQVDNVLVIYRVKNNVTIK